MSVYVKKNLKSYVTESHQIVNPTSPPTFGTYWILLYSHPCISHIQEETADTLYKVKVELLTFIDKVTKCISLTYLHTNKPKAPISLFNLKQTNLVELVGLMLNSLCAEYALTVQTVKSVMKLNVKEKCFITELYKPHSPLSLNIIWPVSSWDCEEDTTGQAAEVLH